MKHTQGKLRVEYDPSCDGDPLTLIMPEDAEMYEKFVARCEFDPKGDGVRDCTPIEAEANAKRIVALWNFAQGFDTETLAAGPDLKEILGWKNFHAETIRVLEHALEQIIDDHHVRMTGASVPIEEVEDCWCYDEFGGAPDEKPGRCLPCRISDLLTKLRGE